MLLEILLSFLGDVLFGAVVSVFDGRQQGPGNQYLRLLGFGILGCLAGLGSVLAFPTLLISSPALRQAWLIASPVVAGASVYVFHLLFFRSQSRTWPVVHAAALAFSSTLIRLLTLS